MIRALYSARTGLAAQQLQLDTVSNNLANVNTAGFKKARIQFEDLYYQTLRDAGVETAGGSQIPVGIQVGLGVRPAAVERLYTQGDLIQTGNELDWAIQGRGFFQVVRDGQEYYTRAGNFSNDSDGFIVTQNGDRLQPEFAIPADAVSVAIDSSGLLTALDENNNTLATAQVTLFDFINPAGLKAAGSNLFQVTDASGDPKEANPGTDGLGTIAQRFLETSNVDVAEEIVNLIITQRAFETNSRAITTADALLEIANNMKR